MNYQTVSALASRLDGFSRTTLRRPLYIISGFYNIFDRWNFAFYENYIPFSFLMIDTTQAIRQSDAGIIILLSLS